MVKPMKTAERRQDTRRETPDFGGRAHDRGGGLGRAAGTRPRRDGRLRGRGDLQRGRRPRRTDPVSSTPAPSRPWSASGEGGCRPMPRGPPATPAEAIERLVRPLRGLHGLRRRQHGSAGAPCSSIACRPGPMSPTGTLAEQRRLFNYVEGPLRVLQPDASPERLAMLARTHRLRGARHRDARAGGEALPAVPHRAARAGHVRGLGDRARPGGRTTSARREPGGCRAEIVSRG